MNKQSIVEFVLHPAGWPLALFFAWHSVSTYYRGTVKLRNGQTLDKRATPIRFWFEVVGGVIVACLLAITGTIYLSKLLIGRT